MMYEAFDGDERAIAAFLGADVDEIEFIDFDDALDLLDGEDDPWDFEEDTDWPF